jgi:hypothetical protein
VRLISGDDTLSVQEPIDPALLWLGREMAKLKDELGLLDQVQHALVSAICSVRLGDADWAEAQLASFDALKSVLPRDHQALIDEPYVRRGLSELKGRDARATIAK